MKQKKNPQGTIVMFLETDLQKSLPFDENSLTSLQKQYFAQLSVNEQEKIRAGYGTVIASLENKETLCEFNMETYQYVCQPESEPVADQKVSHKTLV